MKQLRFNLPTNEIPKAKSVSSTQKLHGGEHSIGKRKSRRPLDVKLPLHLVLRADSKHPIFLNHTAYIDKTIRKYAAHFAVKVYEKSINANHLHLIIKFSRRQSYQSFVRAVSGVLALKLKLSWLNLPFTRILSWGKDFKQVCRYVIKNQKEAWGLLSYTPRTDYS